MALMTEPFTRKAKEAQRKFFNKMQRMGMAIAAHDEYWVCSRGTGKSEGLDARFIIRNVWSMPGSTGALISPSYAKAWGNTLPAIIHALANGAISRAFISLLAARHPCPPTSESPSARRFRPHGAIAFISGMAPYWSYSPSVKGCQRTPCP